MNNTSPLRLALVRHGETIFNRQNRFTGQKDPLLTSTGQAEAEALAKSLQVRFPNGISKICSSHLLRCKNTAEIIAAKVSVTDSDHLEIFSSLAEIDHGVWSGLKKQVVKERYPQEYALWISQPQLLVMPGREKFQDFQDRVLRTVLKISTENTSDNPVLVVCHEQVIRIVLSWITGLGFWNFSVENCAFFPICLHQLTTLEAPVNADAFQLTS